MHKNSKLNTYSFIIDFLGMVGLLLAKIITFLDIDFYGLIIESVNIKH